MSGLSSEYCGFAALRGKMPTKFSLNLWNYGNHNPSREHQMGTLIPGQSDVSSAEPMGNIALFFIPLGGISAELQAQAMAWLSEDERAKVARYRAPEAQMNALLVRAALRAVLSTTLSKTETASTQPFHPKDWCFEYGPKGKPSLTAVQRRQTGLDFNVSHSGDWLLIGVVKAQNARSVLFGVDIERSRPKTDIYPILNHYFSPQETSALLSLKGESNQRQRFFDLWALKESYIKATGLGLAQSLKSFAFDLAAFDLVQDRHVNLSVSSYLSGQLELKPIEIQGDVAFNVSPNLPLFGNIPVLQLGPSDAHQWLVYFGRLNDEYRFAFSLAVNDSTLGKLALSMQMLSVDTLLSGI